MSVLVKDLMTKNVLTARDNEDLSKIYDLMVEQHIRHVPILNAQNELVGIISHRDVVRYILSVQSDGLEPYDREAICNIQVARVMHETPLTIKPNDNIQVAGKLMLEKKIGSLPVVENKKLLGILTEADFVKYVINKAEDKH